jgi:hypothetical protein
MKIIHCPKGSRVPEGYCRTSCLNYPGETELEKHILERKPNEGISPLPSHFARHSHQPEKIKTRVHFPH